MNTIFGIIMLLIAYGHTRIAIDPNRADRSYVRWNAVFLAIITALFGLEFLGLIGPGPA